MRQVKSFWVNMKQKIIAALKTRYKNIGLGEKAFDGVAAFLEKTVTKEEDIEAAVAGDDVAALVRAIQGDQDSLRAMNTELQRSLDKLREAGSGKTDPKPGEGSEKDDAALKELKERFDKLEENYTKVMARERNGGITAELRKRLKDKGSDCEPVLDLILKDLQIAETDTADTLVDRCVASYDETYKRFYGDGPAPRSGKAAPEGYKRGDFSGEVERLRSEGKLPQQK